MNDVPVLPLKHYLRAALSDATRRAYRSDLRRFLASGGTLPATPEQVATYLAAHAQTHKPATLARWRVAIGRAHAAKGLPDPTRTELVRTALQGIRRTHGAAQRQATPLLKDDLLAIVAAMGERLQDRRDRALLLLGFAGAFRRSELVALNVDDLEAVAEGLIVSVRRSKGDQHGAGRTVGIPFARGIDCPVRALRAWLSVADIKQGAVFRAVSRHGWILPARLSAHAVALIVKERARAVGLDPTGYSGHSLRSGLATSAAGAGVPVEKIRAQTGHKSAHMLARYIRDGQLFQHNAAAIL
jgi:integrase